MGIMKDACYTRAQHTQVKCRECVGQKKKRKKKVSIIQGGRKSHFVMESYSRLITDSVVKSEAFKATHLSSLSSLWRRALAAAAAGEPQQHSVLRICAHSCLINNYYPPRDTPYAKNIINITGLIIQKKKNCIRTFFMNFLRKNYMVCFFA